MPSTKLDFTLITDMFDVFPCLHIKPTPFPLALTSLHSLEPPDKELQRLKGGRQKEVLRQKAAELLNSSVQARHHIWGLLVTVH